MNDPVYKETVENSSSYNERLVKERKLRLPFIDAQTGVAQSIDYCLVCLVNCQLCHLFSLGDCYIWSNKLDRMPGYCSAQLYSYPARRWRKKRRQYLLNHNFMSNNAKESEQNNFDNINSLSHHENNATSNATASYISNSGPSVAQNGNGLNVNNCTANSGLNDTFEDSKDSWLRDYDDGSDLPDAGELDDPESDFDDYEEYSSRKKKSKRKDSLKKKRVDYSDAEKPFQCELCGARYKTRPGLSYHYGHSHQESGNGSLAAGNGISEEEREIMYNNNTARNAPSSGNNSLSAPNHSSHPNLMNIPQNSQPPVNSSQSNHLQNNSSSSKPLNSSDDKDKKGNHILT